MFFLCVDFQHLINGEKRKGIDFMLSYNRKKAKKTILLSSFLLRLLLFHTWKDGLASSKIGLTIHSKFHVIFI
jgi:hypothetical protein